MQFKTDILQIPQKKVKSGRLTDGTDRAHLDCTFRQNQKNTTPVWGAENKVAQ